LITHTSASNILPNTTKEEGSNHLYFQECDLVAFASGSSTYDLVLSYKEKYNVTDQCIIDDVCDSMLCKLYMFPSLLKLSRIFYRILENVFEKLTCMIIKV
jgi:hypothetical protein